MDRDWFEKVLNFLPPSLRNNAVVAGGYAASPQLAKDIDLWVLSDPPALVSREGTMIKNRERILDWLQGLDPVVKFEVFSPEALYDGAPEKHLVATIPNAYEGKPIQILVSRAMNPQELVDSFDISTHAIAKQIVEGKHHGEPSLAVIFAKEWTTPKERPFVMRFTTPEETLARLHKIVERYGVPPRDLDVLKLIDAIKDKNPDWTEVKAA